MQQINIALVRIGHQSQVIDFDIIKHWPSGIFKIHSISALPNIKNADGAAWEYSDDQLRDIVQPVTGADITVGVLRAPLERNFYSRRLGNNVQILSGFEIFDILKANNYSVEHFIVRNIYQYIIYYYAFGKSIPRSGPNSWSHTDVRGCLFDFNVYKQDILNSMDRPGLCSQCREKLKNVQLDVDFVPTLDRELSKIKKDLFYTMSDWVKAHPIWSIVLTALAGLSLNILASIIFEFIKKPILGFQ